MAIIVQVRAGPARKASVRRPKVTKARSCMRTGSHICPIPSRDIGAAGVGIIPAHVRSRLTHPARVLTVSAFEARPERRRPRHNSGRRHSPSLHAVHWAMGTVGSASIMKLFQSLASVAPIAGRSGPRRPGLGRLAAWASCLALSGCGVLDRGFLSPAGPVAQVIHDEFLLVCLVMLFVIGPVLLLVPLVAWHYRLSNTKSAYRPQWGFSWPLEGLIWIPPAASWSAGRVPVARHPPARPLQAAARRGDRGAGDRGRLEVDVHLPGAGRRHREPAGDPGRAAGAPRA